MDTACFANSSWSAAFDARITPMSRVSLALLVAGLSAELNHNTDALAMLPLLNSCRRLVRFLPLVKTAVLEAVPDFRYELFSHFFCMLKEQQCIAALAQSLACP